jgi:hypothetical protein
MKKGAGVFLVQFREFEWMICRVPIKLVLNGRRCMYCILSCKYVSFVEKGERDEEDIEDGIF